MALNPLMNIALQMAQLKSGLPGTAPTPEATPMTPAATANAQVAAMQPQAQIAQQAQQMPAQVATALGGGTQAAPQDMAQPSWWEKVLQQFTGVDSQGNPLQGQDLANFRLGNSLGALLGNLGAGIGKGTPGGNLAEAVYQSAAGNLSAMNTAQSEKTINDYLTAMLGQQGKQPTGQQATKLTEQQTTVTPTGGTSFLETTKVNTPQGEITYGDLLKRMQNITDGIA